ncbi:ankyrin-3-like [Copidosoma floridanum]|uniref:ankyrin-3-like n=1 Tax=Copidosoma floridanum TaxID=29053 RepID=UPI0006C9D44C|nr:ankyrin-3-like [Copidosoma floridanum]
MTCLLDMDRNYSKLAQLKHKFSAENVSVNDVKTFLKTGLDVNYTLPFNYQNQHPADQYSGNTALHFAVMILKAKDRNPILKLLITQGANFMCQNRNGFTPLRLAFEIHKTSKMLGDNKNTLNILLSAHLNFNIVVNPRCPNGISHLHIACVSNNFDIVEFFLKAGEPINEAINADSPIYPGYTLLHLAMGNEDKKMVQLLLQHGADPYRLNAKGMSPMHLIIEKHINDTALTGKLCDKKLVGNENILNLLSPVENSINLSDCVGLSLFHIYCMKKHSFKAEEWEIFFMNGIDLTFTVNFDSPICPGYTALHFAANCNFQTVMLLLERGADLLAKDTYGVTPFDLCLKKFRPSDIGVILQTQNQLKSVRFQNNEFLSDVLANFDSVSKLEEYLKTVNVNNAILMNSCFWPGFTYLHLAVIFSPGMDRFRIGMCLKYGADITIQDANSMTALHLAFRMNRKRCVTDILVYHGNVAVNPVDNNSLSHFHISCTANSMTIPKLFLAHGQDPNLPTQADSSLQFILSLNRMSEATIPPGSTALHIAVTTEAKGFIKVLINHGADPNIVDANGFTWVHRAFVSEKFDKFKSLLWFPSKEPTGNLVAPGGLSYLHIACYADNLTAVEKLLSLTANINEPLNSDLMRYIKTLPESICIGDTPLHLAVKASSETIVSLLLKHGASIEAKNAKGMNPLHVALLMSSSQPLIKYLAMEFNHKSTWIDDSTGLTRLHVACALDDVVFIKSSLDYGEDIHSRMNQNSPLWPNYTPLNVLIRNGYPENDHAVKLLLEYYLKKYEYSIQIDQGLHGLAKRQKMSHPLQNQYLFVNVEGLSAFHVSCMGNDISIIQKFLQYGADINLPKDYFSSSDAGFTPLHFAVEHGRKNVIEILSRYGANFYLENSNGHNPIFLAVLKCLSSIETFTSGYEVDLSMKNSFGQSIMDVFLENKTATSSTLKQAVENIPKLANVDGNRRNVIHHLVLPFEYDYTEIKTTEFIRNVELLLINGCELDLQDKHGRTPLHYSVLSSKPKKIESLLLIGADINVIDINGETPYMYCFKVGNYVPEEVCELFHNYVDKIKAAGLYLHPLNEECYKTNALICKRAIYEGMLEKMNIKVSSFHTVRYLLTEKVVMTFIQKTYNERQLILKCLEYEILHKQFPMWSPLFKLQHRKILQKLKQLEPVTQAMLNLVNPYLTEKCIKFILAQLNEEDWKNLICASKMK